jgi:ribosomal-protein-alanine N-acetyltransferase
VLKLLSFVKMCMRHLPEVHEIEKGSFALPWSIKTLEGEVHNPTARYLVVIEDGVVVGYGGYWKILSEAHITNVAIKPAKRGCGIGRHLMDKLIELAAAEGICDMTLEVRASNARARALYKSMGFLDVGIRPRYYTDNNEDALIMWLHKLPSLKAENDG